MIIACPACATRYAVPDSAIGVEGRTVRCAKCKHSWFQDGPDMAEPMSAAYADSGEAVGTAEPTHRPPQSQSRPASQVIADAQPHHVEERPRIDEPSIPTESTDARSEDAKAIGGAASSGLPNAIPVPVDRATTVSNPDSSYDSDNDDYSHFDHGPLFRPRRNWLRWLTWGAGAFAALALAAIAAMSVLGTPSWLPIEKPMFGADPGLEVEFPASEQERRTLPNGAEFFGARVVVKNPARETKRVPPLLIVLRDARERVVYSWELVPPQSTLAPGEAMTINEAVTDVPKSAVFADIGWAPR